MENGVCWVDLHGSNILLSNLIFDIIMNHSMSILLSKNFGINKIIYMINVELLIEVITSWFLIMVDRR